MAMAYFDAHCDTLTRFRSLRRSSETHWDLTRLRAYGPAGQIMAIFAEPGMDGEDTFRRIMEHARWELDANADIAALCTSAAEADAAAAEGKTALFLAVEGANLLGCSVDSLRAAYGQGVRLVTLCWNEDNALCGAALDTGAGLTPAGEAFVDACWALGVAVDLSHTSENTFWDVVRRAARPVICSHSNAKALCDHPRNLTDAQLRALIENGGYVGLNLCLPFVGLTNDIDAMVAHAEHILALGAEKNLGLGTDFDGIEEAPRGIHGVEDMGKLYEALLRRGYTESLVRDIFYNNLHRFMESAL